MTCIFCDIINRKKEADILYEDDIVIAVLDSQPLSLGHTLVISKEHFENFRDLVTAKVLFSNSEKLSTAVVDATGADGFNIIMNNGAVAGQIINHAHFHIIPRYTGDGLFFNHSRRTFPIEKTKAVYEAIKEKLK